MPSLTDTNQGKCASAIISTIQGLGLTGIADAAVVYRNPPNHQNLTFPAIIVSDWEDRLADTFNDLDDVVFSFSVAIVQGLQDEDATSQIDRLQWRETIRQAFHNKRQWAASVVGPSMIISRVELAASFDAAARRQGYEAQYLFIRCQVREVRS